MNYEKNNKIYFILDDPLYFYNVIYFICFKNTQLSISKLNKILCYVS